MRSEIKMGLICLGGALIGSSLTYIFLNKKYAKNIKVLNDEFKKNIEEQKQVDKDKLTVAEKLAADILCSKVMDEKADKKEDTNNTTNYSSIYKEDSSNNKDILDSDLHVDSKENNSNVEKDIYVLTDPNDFGSKEDYDMIYLTYYADGYLVDDRTNIVEDTESTVGFEALDSFGIYSNDPDLVYVRNNILKADYEVCSDDMNYKSDISDSEGE